MARARNIKPSFFQNEDLGEIAPLARLFFIGLWTISDYNGCVELRAKRLKIQLMPYDDCDIDSLANILDKSGFISIYSVLDQKYIKIINFKKHQNPHKNERDAGSKIPDINNPMAQVIDSKGIEIKSDKIGNNPEEDGSAPADSLFPLPSSLIPIPDTEEKKSSPAAPKFSAKKALMDLSVTEQVASDFIAMRKAKLTETAISGIKREADKAGFTLEDALKECVARGWQGFKADWVNKGNPSTGKAGMSPETKEFFNTNYDQTEAVKRQKENAKARGLDYDNIKDEDLIF